MEHINNLPKNAVIRTFSLFILAGGLMYLTIGCNPDARGFKLPDGEAGAGKMVFLSLQCNQCHSIADIAWEGDEAGNVHVQLGGEVRPAKTYGELLTSVINPSHKIARTFQQDNTNPDGTSVMEQSRINEVMTVQQLVDLVTFLEAQYELQMPRDPYTYKGW